MSEVFDWTPDFGATKSKKPKVNTIQFGDGYQQRVAHGFNTDPESWSVVFANRDEDETNEIDEFLTDRGGVEAFTWTPPGADDSAQFICAEWTRTVHKANLYTINATFVQVFEPS